MASAGHKICSVGESALQLRHVSSNLFKLLSSYPCYLLHQVEPSDRGSRKLFAYNIRQYP